MKIQTSNGRHAFSVCEALVAWAVLVLLLVIFLPAFSRSPRQVPLFQCVNNLKQVGIAFRIWKEDNDAKLPMDVPVASGGAAELTATGNVAACFQVMSNELATPRIVYCPSDTHGGLASNFGPTLTRSNVSYFIGLNASETNIETVLSGDSNPVQNGRPVRAGILNLWANTTTWTPDRHHGDGNVLVADESVLTLNKISSAPAAKTYNATNRVVVP